MMKIRPLLLAVFVIACGSERSAEPAAEPSTQPPPQTPSTPSSDEESDADPCRAIQEEFGRVLRTATGSCTQDDECGCFDPVIGEAGCGGITDSATTNQLRAITTRFHEAGCPWPHQCGPWACMPVCREGQCRNSSAGGMIVP